MKIDKNKHKSCDKVAILIFTAFLLSVAAGVAYSLKFRQHHLGSGYASLNQQIYYQRKLISQADPASFEVLKNGFARDKNFSYYDGFPFGGGSSKTLEILNDKYARDQDYGYAYLPDGRIIRAQGSDGKTFEITERQDYLRDQFRYYYFDGKDFHTMERHGFTFIDNNPDSDARDEFHFYLKGEMVAETPEFKEHLESIGRPEREKIKKEANDKRAKLEEYFSQRDSGVKGEFAKEQDLDKKFLSTHLKIIDKITKGPPYYEGHA